MDRHHAGVYQCAADNGVKEPVSKDITLTILCKYLWFCVCRSTVYIVILVVIIIKASSEVNII